MVYAILVNEGTKMFIFTFHFLVDQSMYFVIFRDLLQHRVLLQGKKPLFLEGVVLSF